MSGRPTRSKVARLIEEYGLGGIGDELEERWTRSEDRHGLRRLAEYFNRRLLRGALSSGEPEPLDGEIENLYRLLTDDEVSSGVRTRARARLEGAGVDPDRLEEDFVSYGAVYTYLTEFRDAEPPDETPSEEEQIEAKRRTVQRLRNRLVAVVERSLGDLRDAGRLTLGEFDVLVTVRVHCTDCGTQRSVTRLLDDRGCECDAA